MNRPEEILINTERISVLEHDRIIQVMYNDKEGRRKWFERVDLINENFNLMMAMNSNFLAACIR